MNSILKTKWPRFAVAVLCVALIFCVACGYKGPPKPPVDDASDVIDPKTGKPWRER